MNKYDYTFIYVLAASPHRACDGRQTFGFAFGRRGAWSHEVLKIRLHLTKGASRPDKELAYGEQNIQPSVELKPAYGEK